MSKIKDTFQYMADLDGLKSSLPRGERPPLRTRHNQATRFSIADGSDRIRLSRGGSMKTWRHPF